MIGSSSSRTVVAAGRSVQKVDKKLGIGFLKGQKGAELGATSSPLNGVTVRQISPCLSYTVARVCADETGVTLPSAVCSLT